MQEGEEKEKGQQQAETQDEDVICSNQLLAAIRKRMAAERRTGKQPKDLGLEDKEEESNLHGHGVKAYSSKRKPTVGLPC